MFQNMNDCEPTALLTDNDLMLKVREGEVETLGILFERYQKLLLHFFLRFTRNHALSEDLVQEVFVRILKYRHTFGPESQFACWMYRIARNIHCQHYRKHGRETLQSEETHPGEIPDEELLPDESLDRRQQITLLHQALAELPPEKREVLILSRVQHLKYREIAERLSCDVGTVKVRIFRATREIAGIFRRISADKFLAGAHLRMRTTAHSAVAQT